MASFRDIWNLIVTGDTSDVDRKLGGLAKTAESTGATAETSFRNKMGTALSDFGQKIPGVSGLMDKFGVSSSQAGALMGTAVAAGATAAGIAVERFVVASIDQFQQQAQEVLHFQEVTGLAADEASRFVAVADDFKVSAQDLSTEVGRLNKTAEDSPDKLSALGIEIGKTKDGAYDAKQTFLNVVDAFNATDDASLRASIGSAAFGKNWQSMVNLLEQGSGKLEESFAAVDDFQIFDEEDLRKSEEYRHALDDLNDAVKGIERDIGEKLVPVLSKAVTEFANMIEEGEKLGGPIGKGFQMLGVDAGDFFKVLTNPGGAALDRVKDLGGAIEDLFGKDKGDKPIKSIYDLVDAQVIAGAQAGQWKRAQRETEQATLDATAATQAYVENSAGMRQALDDQREAAKQATQALKDYRDAAHDLLNEQLGLEGATNSAKDAIDDYNTKVLDHTTTVKELRDANLDVRESWVSLGDQAVATATQQAELHGATLDAKGALDAQVTSLQTLFAQLAPDSPLRVALDQYILQLYNIPGQIVTNVDLTGNGLDVLGRSVGGTRREGSGADIVSQIKAYESSNGTGWRQ